MKVLQPQGSHGKVVPVTIPPQGRAELEPITHSTTA